MSGASSSPTTARRGSSWGDFHAMIGSLDVADGRVQELLTKYGAEMLTNACDQLLDYSERFMRAEIAGMPDGVYYAQDQMEDDGVTQPPVLDAAASHDPRRRGHL